MPLRLGFFGDAPDLGTGMGIVGSYLVYYLENISPSLRTIYFGRYGQQKGFAKNSLISEFPFEYVPCQGGTWTANMIGEIVKHYNLDVLATIDDWWSIRGFLSVAKRLKKPFHFITPLDSLPIHPMAYSVFKKCDKIYVPNRSWKIINKHLNQDKALYLPYGVDVRRFRSVPQFKEDKFTFVWVGRDEKRKALGRAILAFEAVCKSYDTQLLIRTDWRIPNAVRTRLYIEKRNLPVITEQITRCNHSELAKTYNRGHVLICSSKAGGFEMSITEAMACEVPALVTNWNFMNEHIVHGKNGFKIPCDHLETVSFNRIWGSIDINKLAFVMKWCVEHQELVKGMGRWGRQWVMENHLNWREQTKRLYNGINKKYR